MGLIVKPSTFSAGGTIVASEHNNNYDTVYNEFNGNIDNANVKAAAAILASKIDMSSPPAIGGTVVGNASFGNLVATSGNLANITVSNLHVPIGNVTGVNGQFLRVTGTNLTWQSVFVDRGDPAAADYSMSDLTTDGNWNALDLSALISASNAKAVLLRVQVQDDAADSSVSFKTNGNSNDYNISQTICTAANKVEAQDKIVPLDSGRVIQYKTTATAFTDITLVVKGWWF